jgi:tetratricopeptide (TPR) repeat protein
MTLPKQLHGLAEVRGALTVDPQGRLIAATPTLAGATPDGAAAIAAALQNLAQAGADAGLGPLVVAHLKGAASSLLGAVRDDALLLVHVEPSRMTSAAEKAVRAWTLREDAPASAGAPPAAAPAAPATPPPMPAAVAAPPVRATPARGVPAATATAGGVPAPTAAPSTAPRDPWAALRHALGRGQLNEAASLRHALVAATAPGRPGAEPLSREACDRAVQILLEGVGSVMAGDGLGGAGILRELAGEDQPNTSVRWLALQWSARATVKSSAVAAARGHVQEALTLARQLDVEARALSQWTAAEVLAHDSDSTRALSWLAESRSRFQRAADRWGIGQTFLSEARILFALERYGAASEAALRAAEYLPASDEPTVLLSRLALLRGETDAAESLLRPLRTQAAEKVRALIGAIRDGVVTRPDASEYLREHDAAPSQRSLRALARIATAAPQFLQAREALAWMLLRVGRYEDAGGLFRALLSQPLSGADRASVMLGLGCVANAGRAAAPAHAVVAAATRPPPADAAPFPPAPTPTTSQVLPPRAGGTATPDAVFSGQLSSFALPDLLEFLRSARRSGLLVCSGPVGMGALRFRDGRISGAASPTTPGLRELLVRDGKLSAAALEALASTSGAPDQPDELLADQIVRGGHADAAVVAAALEAQVWAAVRELVEWTDGEFAFNREETPGPADGGVSVSLDPQAVLLDVFRQRDEASRTAPETVH